MKSADISAERMEISDKDFSILSDSSNRTCFMYSYNFKVLRQVKKALSGFTGELS